MHDSRPGDLQLIETLRAEASKATTPRPHAALFLEAAGALDFMLRLIDKAFQRMDAHTCNAPAPSKPASAEPRIYTIASET